MAQVIVDIPDGSMELNELMHALALAQVTSPSLTATQFVSNLVMGFTQARIKNYYKGHVNALTLEQMAEKLGSLDSVRS